LNPSRVARDGTSFLWFGAWLGLFPPFLSRVDALFPSFFALHASRFFLGFAATLTIVRFFSPLTWAVQFFLCFCLG